VSSNTQDHDFDEAFRRWAARPPVTSSGNAARAAVVRLQAEGGSRSAGQGLSLAGRRRRGLSPAWVTLVVTLIVLVAGTASFIRTLPSVSPIPARENAARPSPVPAREADVLLWLDDGTPVYVFLPDGN
jgi:hypothetical protein